MDNVLNIADKAKDIDNESREVNFLKSKKITWKKADSAFESLINFCETDTRVTEPRRSYS